MLPLWMQGAACSCSPLLPLHCHSMLSIAARAGRLPLLRAARAGLATASRPPGPGEKVAQ